jgi:hypothetical protein
MKQYVEMRCSSLGRVHEGHDQGNVWRKPKRIMQYWKDSKQTPFHEIEGSSERPECQSFYCLWWFI